MNTKPISSLTEYHETLKEIENLMMARPDTPEGEKLNILVSLIVSYEIINFPMK
jgi:HTH-type transcriptional regulator / antitoxin HigA